MVLGSLGFFFFFFFFFFYTFSDVVFSDVVCHPEISSRQAANRICESCFHYFLNRFVFGWLIGPILALNCRLHVEQVSFMGSAVGPLVSAISFSFTVSLFFFHTELPLC